MSYIDTNVLISYINPNDALHGKAVELLEKLGKEKVCIGTNYYRVI